MEKGSSVTLSPQGMESSPGEEVFLGAFQFQPENIIQMFPLQVPVHLLCPPWAPLFPPQPGRYQ